MEIIELRPQGFCKGVINALEIVNKTLSNPRTPRPVYILGPIIHNKKITEDLKQKGAITIYEKGKNRLELLDKIENGTVIFSAHGVSPQVYKKALAKGLNIVDASCQYVLKIQELIAEKITLGYEIIYIGVKNHPESEGVIGINSKIHFIDKKDDVSSLNIDSEKIYITNQTTLGFLELDLIYHALKEKYPHSLIENGICMATTARQKAVYEQKKVDLCLVIGDKSSSNTNKLAKISEDICKIKTYLIEDVNDLKKIDLTNIKSVSITSGASTPSFITKEIKEYLRLI